MATVVEQIVNREIDAVIVFESENVIAFADYDPINFGHILICPTFPYESFIELPKPIHDEIQEVARDLYSRIMEKFQPVGMSFIQNNGKCNELDHLHIFPRYDDDQFGWKSSELGIQTIEQLKESLIGL
ncbi:HIT family protein [Vibrio algarum]|uniref:HIT family protein n=1 Tax=Vibrio algarum TaxID=3020714 RepID=A0ABT4YWZ1_9VIBR|nr:HIT family protein [Vibrio sp. KJ40-1]MDB1126018.1 HIT family protein [Vibrio sp. KJ40-1]